MNAPVSPTSKRLVNHWRWLLLTGVIGSFLLAPQPASAAPFATGDVFAAVGNSKANVFNPSTGGLKQTLNDGNGATFTTGMCFDAAGNFYMTDFSNIISKFDSSGNLVDPTFVDDFPGSAESCVWNASNQMYVGGPGAPIAKYDSSGTLLDTFTTEGAEGTDGTDWIDLAADQCTMLYTDEGREIGRFDVCTDTQLTPFAEDLPAPCFALRIRPNGEVMVACQPVQRLNSSGAVIQSYSNANGKFALNLDPDGTSFWTGDIGGFTNDIFRFDIASGNELKNFSSNGDALYGLAVFGELTQGIQQGKISARGTVNTAQGPTIGFSAANNCVQSQSTKPSIIGTTTGAVIWTKTSVTDSECTDAPPDSPLGFDTQTGTATGTFGPSAPGGRNGQSGTLAWTYQDGTPDTVQFTLRDSSNTVVYQAASQTPSAYRGSTGGVWTFGP